MGRFNRSGYAVLGVVLMACGAKTEILDDRPFDDGSFGGSGALGAGGTTGGGAGRAGSGGRAGSAGVSGSGGSSGGSAGTGGLTTGGAGGVGGSNQDKIGALCSWLAQHGCGFESCRESWTRDTEIYNLWGCGDEWLETGVCRLRDPAPCNPNEATGFCGDARQRFTKCLDEADVCIRGNKPEGGCEIGCETWRSDCRPAPQGLICTCTTGRRNGFQFFTADPCQSEQWIKSARMACE